MMKWDVQTSLRSFFLPFQHEFISHKSHKTTKSIETTKKYTMSSVSSESLSMPSTQSGMRRRNAIVQSKEMCEMANAAAEEARIMLEARIHDLQVAEQEEAPEISERASRALQEAREEYEALQALRDTIMDNYSKLAESEVQATMERDLARYGSLGRFPSCSLIVNEGNQRQNPWLDADIGRPWRKLPIGSRRRVAKFYKKLQWNRTMLTKVRLQCMASCVWSYDPRKIVACRILPKSTSRNILDSLGLTRADINSPRNMLLLARNIQRSFEMQKLTFLLDEDGMTTEMGLCFRLKIWDSTIKDKPIFNGSKMTIGDCDGKMFRFYSDENIPFVRALSLHAQRTYERAKDKGYIEDNEPRPAEYGSPLPCESITCDSSNNDDDYSLESDRSIATEELLEPLDYEIGEI